MDLAWEPSLSVKVKEIDEQHKKLIDLINQLYQAMKTGKGKEVIAKILEELGDYTQYHFATEEKYLGETSYPDLKAHQDEHINFVGKVADFTKKYNAGHVGLTVQLFQFLHDWLINHISGSDKKYSDHLNKNGIN